MTPATAPRVPLRLPPPNRDGFTEPAAELPPVPAVSAGESFAQVGPLRMNEHLPEQPRPTPEGLHARQGKFAPQARTVDPVPAGSIQIEPPLDDTPVPEQEFD